MKSTLPYLLLIVMTLAGCQTVPEEPAPTVIDSGFYDDLFDDAFFEASNDPFQEMARIHGLLRSNSPLDAQLPSFTAWYLDTYGQFPPQWIYMQHNDKQVSYRLSVDENERASINIRTEGSLIHLQGQLTLENPNSTRSRKIDQRLPLPQGVDPTSVFFYKQGTELVIQMDRLMEKGI